MLGQVGWLGALAEVSGLSRLELEPGLARLEAREFLQRAPASRVAGEVEYAFRHTLVRDVAYGQVLRAERAGKHRRAAEWIEGLAPDRAEGRAELLAYHYRAALSFARAAGTEPPGLAARALGALRDAGDRAARPRRLGDRGPVPGRGAGADRRGRPGSGTAPARPRPGPLPGRDGRGPMS